MILQEHDHPESYEQPEQGEECPECHGEGGYEEIIPGRSPYAPGNSPDAGEIQWHQCPICGGTRYIE
jgi:ssDNA-binding Zn-finger/Zn-ribbon topoisomerase 1